MRRTHSSHSFKCMPTISEKRPDLGESNWPPPGGGGGAKSGRQDIAAIRRAVSARQVRGRGSRGPGLGSGSAARVLRACRACKAKPLVARTYVQPPSGKSPPL
jgi:hypothetical protein